MTPRVFQFLISSSTKILLTVGILLSLSKLSKAQYTDLHNFHFTDGDKTVGSLTRSLTGDTLFGMTLQTTTSPGAIVSIQKDGSGFADILYFNDASSPQGAGPLADLTLSSSGKILYGMTPGGGVDGYGCIFLVNTDGSGYVDLHDFNGTDGADPIGSLVLSGGVLYGTVSMGGANGLGCIFSINIDGTGYTDLYDFTATTGETPRSLTLSSGILYGMTWGGGSSGQGNIYSIHTDGTSFTDLYDFNSTYHSGFHPNGNLTLSITGDTLFGMTQFGGATANYGVIFSIKTNGSGYTDMHNFDHTTGAYPYGSLTLKGGSTLYGMTYDGGETTSYGILFTINTDGSGFADLLNFNGGPSAPEGNNPSGSLTLSITGDTLYGMTPGGGNSIAGVIFSFIPPGFPVTTAYYCH